MFNLKVWLNDIRPETHLVFKFGAARGSKRAIIRHLWPFLGLSSKVFTVVNCYGWIYTENGRMSVWKKKLPKNFQNFELQRPEMGKTGQKQVFLAIFLKIYHLKEYFGWIYVANGRMSERKKIFQKLSKFWIL